MAARDRTPFPARAAFALLLAALLPLYAGCGAGLIYTHRVTPLDRNLRATPVYSGEGKGDVKQIRYSVADVRWDSNAIGDIARREGIETVYYADMELLSVLGIWTQRTVHIYGR